MRARSILFCLPCAALALTLAARTPVQGVVADSHTLNNCEIDVMPQPVGDGMYSVNAYYTYKNEANTVTGTVSFAPPESGKVGLGDWNGAVYVPFKQYTKNSATFVYDKATGKLGLTLSNGTDSQVLDDVAYEGVFDMYPLEPMSLELVELAPQDDQHSRSRVLVDLYGLHTGFTLFDL